MSSSMPRVALFFVGLAILQMGCDRETALERLTLRFDAMKSATTAFHKMLTEVTDAESAEALLPQLEESHQLLAITVQELEEAEITTSRATVNIKREIADLKKEQKALFKAEFERLKSDKFVKAVLEPFLNRLNAL